MGIEDVGLIGIYTIEDVGLIGIYTIEDVGLIELPQRFVQSPPEDLYDV
jgi:hypothetical protein